MDNCEINSFSILYNWFDVSKISSEKCLFKMLIDKQCISIKWISI